MEQIVKASGKWHDVTELSVSRLSDILEVGNWPRAVLSELEKLTRIVPAFTVRLSRAEGSPDNKGPDGEAEGESASDK
jgi:hypothetical protein